MPQNRGFAGTLFLVVSLLVSLFSCGTASAQRGLTAHVGKFTLTHQVQWGKSVLQPGNYTITIESTGSPIIARVRKSDGEAGIFVMSAARSESTGGVNALLIKERNGQPVVHSLALADLGMLLIYDLSLAREAVQEAREKQMVPVLWAKK
jgi:hypothetical protein